MLVIFPEQYNLAMSKYFYTDGSKKFGHFPKDELKNPDIYEVQKFGSTVWIIG